MIKLERTSVMNFENALRGMRNPMQSYDRADSYRSCTNECQTRCAENCAECQLKDGVYIIGPNDLDLARRLVSAGSDDRKFLRQIFVSVDVTAPLYWWKEMDQYRISVTTNSTSTMHKIHAKEFTLDDFSHERLHPRALRPLEAIIEELNVWRNVYNNGGWVDYFDDIYEKSDVYEPKDTAAWHNMIQLLPSSYNQMRTCTLNYENLVNIYYARRYHKLDEWHVFCDWIAGLPYFREFCKGLEEKHVEKTD